MPQILHQQPSGIANVLGGLGAGLGSGLQQLAAQRISQLAQREQQQKAAHFWQALGLPQETAFQFAAAPEAVQKSLLDRLEGINLGIQPQAQMPQSQAPQMATYAQQISQQPEFQTKIAPGGEQVPGIPVPPFTREGIPTSQKISTLQQQAPEQEQQVGIRIGPRPDERRHKEVQSQKEQHHIDKLSTPYFDEIRKQGAVNRELTKNAQDALSLIDKAKTGFKGKITPAFLNTPEGQELVTKLSRIVILNAQTGKGLPSVARLKLESGAKADIWNHPKAIKNILGSIINNPETIRSISEDEAVKELEQKWQGITPRNFKSEVGKRSHQISKVTLRDRSKLELPEASLYLPNTTIEINGIDYKLNKSGTEWREV